MKLIRGICECGFFTHKARSGYHFHRWWFPVINVAEGSLYDVVAELPEADRQRIDDELIHAIQRVPSTDKRARREISRAAEKSLSDVSEEFISATTQRLKGEFDDKPDCIFNPEVTSDSQCPNCDRKALRLAFVKVRAFCKRDCGHEYEWPDSETKGCPICSYRPHGFQTEIEPVFAQCSRTECTCSCSSATSAISHIDGYCPKCGELPESYKLNGVTYCGLHHEEMFAYSAPGNIFFLETESRWVAHRFPNAKLWGDARDDDIFPSAYCKSCENEHQNWLNQRLD